MRISLIDLKMYRNALIRLLTAASDVYQRDIYIINVITSLLLLSNSLSILIKKKKKKKKKKKIDQIFIVNYSLLL